MHKKFYFNNNQSQIKRIRKNLKQQWTKAVCIGTLSATVLTGVPKNLQKSVLYLEVQQSLFNPRTRSNRNFKVRLRVSQFMDDLKW